jgi:HK97 family phage major capsid protein
VPKPNKKNEDILNYTEDELRNERDNLLSTLDQLDEVKNAGNEWSDDQRTSYKDGIERLELVTDRIGNTDEGLAERAAALKVVGNLARLSNNANALSGAIHTRPRFEDDPQNGFNDQRDFLNAVTDLFSNGDTEDPRLKLVIKNTVGSDEYSRGDWESLGLAVPRGFLGTVLTTGSEADFFTGRMTSIPMSTNSLDIPARVDKDHSTSVDGGTIAYRTAETRTAALTKGKYETVSLKTNELNVASAVTRQLLRDSPISIPALIEAGQKDAQQYKRTDEFLFGNGVGRPLGVLAPENEALLALDRTAGQADATILSGSDVLRMRKRVYGYQNAVWIANIDLMEWIFELAIESANNAGIVKLFQPMDPGTGRPDTLLGRPIIWTEFANGIASDDGATIDEWSTYFLSCVNWSQYLYGTRGNGTADRSVHVRFLEREEVFLFTSEDDGRPWWKSVLTPKRGKSTLSPFVTLTNTSVAA